MWLNLLLEEAICGSPICQRRRSDVAESSARGCQMWRNLLPTGAACGSIFCRSPGIYLHDLANFTLAWVG